MKSILRLPRLFTVCLLAAWVLAGCDNDLEDTLGNEIMPPVQVEPEPEPAPVPGPETPAGEFTLSLSSTSVNIREGAGLVSVQLTLDREPDHGGDVTLTAAGMTPADDSFLTSRFTDDVLDDTEQNTTLELDLAIARYPIQPQTRTLIVTGTDTANRRNTTELTIEVQPTDKPDIYLLIGQSNMVGSSEDDAKQDGAGEPDAPVDAIRQLHVTFNDEENFPDAAAFTSRSRIINTDNPLITAQDPLHTGARSDGTKSGTRIGLGLSFAKRALQDTTVDIYLVPAAWSDTGFCKRDSNIVPGIGWNATPKDNSALSGTLLHDRAIARTNIAIEETDGILRGILWHQGEADSEDRTCAQSYAQNLAEMVQSLRTNIDQDARGAIARGADADIPFIAGTMSAGGEQVPFSATKMLVDTAHRNVGTAIRFADFVNGDDLVPPAFPCGGGSCIHFGAEALREMGVRYYDRLISVFP